MTSVTTLGVYDMSLQHSACVDAKHLHMALLGCVMRA
jgi:hypothetical protein